MLQLQLLYVLGQILAQPEKILPPGPVYGPFEPLMAPAANLLGVLLGGFAIWMLIKGLFALAAWANADDPQSSAHFKGRALKFLGTFVVVAVLFGVLVAVFNNILVFIPSTPTTTTIP